MLNQEQLESLLTLAMKSEADFAEIFEEETNSEGISIANENIEEAVRSLKAGAGIRLYKGTESVYGYTNDMTMSALEDLVNELRAAMGSRDEGRTVVLHPEEVKNNHPVKIDPLKAPLAQKTDLLERAVKTGFEQDERIVKMHASINSTVQHVQISNSDGKLVNDTRTRTRMRVNAYAKEGDRMQSGSDAPGGSAGLEFYESHTPEDMAREAVRLALVLLKAKPAPSGEMPVVIDNGFGGVIFHEACGHSLEATGVARNMSVFAGLKGKKIANEKVTAIDDGTIPNAWGSQNIDDEGNPQQRRVLIENGVLNTYMVDQLNSRRMNHEITGSGRRESYRYEPTSRMSNTFIAPGTDKKENMFKSIDFGLYARRMGGGSVNPNTGEFNFTVLEGYLIENGKITDPVIGAALIGSGADILMNIDMVADNLERAQGMCGSVSGSIPTDVGQPAIRVSRITVGGTANE